MKYFNIPISISLLLLGACNLALKIDSGDMAYQLKHYGVAAELYTEEYRTAKDDIAKAYAASMASKSYAEINDLTTAYDWILLRMKIDQSTDDLQNLALLALSQDDYDLAEKAYDNLYKVTNDRNYLNQVGYVQKLPYDKSKYDVSVPGYNSEVSDYSPGVFEGNYITFTSDRESRLAEEVDSYTGRYTSDIYLVSKSNQSTFLFDEPVNSSASEGQPTFSKTYDEVYFTRCISIEERDVHCRIYQSRRRLGSWSEPEPIIFFEETVNVGQPTYMDSDSLLIFSVDDTENYQLYLSRKMDNGWTLPEVMPTSISGPYNERFPVVDADTLYFSSDRFPGYGYLDLYRTYVDSTGYWTAPAILDSPYNSGADDFGYCVLERYPDNDSRVSTVLISSNRVGTTGLDDIFEITEYKVEGEDIEIPTASEDEHSIYLAVSVKDQETKSPLSGNLSLITGNNDKEVVATNALGKFIKTLDVVEGTLVIGAESSGFYYADSTVSIPSRQSLTADTTINVTVFLERIEIGKEIVLENIYYDYDKSNIRPDAEPSLNELVDLLKSNPSISIELASHTDCRGDGKYNYNLSGKRAASAMQYIQQKGISPSRLSSKGYGELRPIANCECDDCTEDQHQQNRRTSFKVVKVK